MMIVLGLYKLLCCVWKVYRVCCVQVEHIIGTEYEYWGIYTSFVTLLSLYSIYPYLVFNSLHLSDLALNNRFPTWQIKS